MQVDILLKSLKSLAADEQKLWMIASRWTLDFLHEHRSLDVPIDLRFARERIEEVIRNVSAHEHEQTAYVDTIERTMNSLDESIDNGEWTILQTNSEEPFVIGDAPAVTWERNERNFLFYGQGFSRPSVEVLLPVSPTTCLHVLPAVPRTRPVVSPAVRGVNQAQAAFSTEYCFSHCSSPAIDAVLQSMSGTTRIGFNAFSVAHRDYTDTLYKLIMSRGQTFEAPDIS